MITSDCIYLNVAAAASISVLKSIAFSAIQQPMAPVKLNLIHKNQGLFI